MTKEKKPVGAPRRLERARAANVSLDLPSEMEALRLGDGKISVGIRIALMESARRHRLGLDPGDDQKAREKLEAKGQKRLTD